MKSVIKTLGRINILIVFSLLLLISCGNREVKKEESTPITSESVAPQKFAAGSLTNHIPCIDDANISFALYMPTSYKEGEKLPLLILFDPHGDPLFPINMYKSLADKHHFMLMGSNDSKNGNAKELTAHIIQLMAKSAYALLPVDSNRVYSGGFSGGGRIAALLAISPSGIQGLVTCGAGFPIYEWNQSTPSVVCAIANDGDMNLPEITNLKSNDPVKAGRLLTFRNKGKHEWPKAEVFEEVFLAFNAFASRDQILTLNSEEKKALNNDYMNIDKSKVYDSNPIYKAYFYERWIKAMDGVANVDDIKKKYVALKSSAALQSAMKTEQQLIKEETDIKENYYKAMGSRDTAWWMNEMTKLSRSISSSNDELKKSQLERIRGGLSLMCYMNLDKTLKAGARDSYIYLSALYRFIDPENSEAWILASQVAAKENKKEDCLNYFNQAIKTGFKEGSRILNTPDFDAMSSDPRFQQLLNSIPR
jgi:hypothetical protein